MPTRASAVYSARLVAQPKWMEKSAEQSALGDSTVDLFQLAQTVVRGIPHYPTTNWI